MVNAHLDWVSNRPYRYWLRYQAGQGQLKVYNGSTLLIDKTFTPNGSNTLRTGDALQLYVKSSAGIGNAKIAITAEKLNGQTLSGALSTRGDNLFNEARLSYFYPGLRTSLELEGKVTLTFSGAIPQGSRLNFMVNAGNLSCNGVAP